MTSALKNPDTSEADYLAAELLSQEKSEYAGGQVFAMAGTSIRRNRIALNTAVALNAKASNDCRVSISDVKFKAKQLYYYPDVMVACASNTDSHCETQPCLIVEVLSDSTEAIDRGKKMHNYQRVPELETYLLVSQSERRIDVYTRAGAFWRFESLVDDAEIALSCPEMRLSLAAIYARVGFEPPADLPLS
jgi:Uma2 family endonuclease